MGKQKRNGKVIRYFTVEVVGNDDPDLSSNPSNPYTLMSPEERLNELIEVFGLLWAESCRDKSQAEPSWKK